MTNKIKSKAVNLTASVVRVLIENGNWLLNFNFKPTLSFYFIQKIFSFNELIRLLQ